MRGQARPPPSDPHRMGTSLVVLYVYFSSLGNVKDAGGSEFSGRDGEEGDIFKLDR